MPRARSSTPGVQVRIGAEARRLRQSQARADSGRHTGHLFQKLARDGLAAVDDEPQARKVEFSVLGQAPLHVEQGGDLAQGRDLVFADGLQALEGIEDVEDDGQAAHVDRRRQLFRDAAHMGRGQVDEHPLLAGYFEGDGQSDILDEDVLVAQEGRFGRSGGSGGEDNQAGVALVHSIAGGLDAARGEAFLHDFSQVAEELADAFGARHDQLGLLLELDPVLHVGGSPASPRRSWAGSLRQASCPGKNRPWA